MHAAYAAYVHNAKQNICFEFLFEKLSFLITAAALRARKTFQFFFTSSLARLHVKRLPHVHVWMACVSSARCVATVLIV
jgi:hypothetical protein